MRVGSRFDTTPEGVQQAVKVFISSVTHQLKDERNALPPFLRLFDHVPLRFEDFTSQDRSSRAACLAGVDAADVYVLLLGPRYGNPFPDTGLAPTAEEFKLARQRGIPILVFNKTVDEADEPAQTAFKAEVGHYVNGRLWKSFTDPLSLNQAVGEALRELPVAGAPLSMQRLTIVPEVSWLLDPGERFSGVDAPVLELQLVPIDSSEWFGAAALTTAPRSLASTLRSSGFVADEDPLDLGSDNEKAWAIRRPHRTGGWNEPSDEAFRGAILQSNGTARAFVSLRSDMFGALVNQQSLQRELVRLLALVAPLSTADVVAPAVALSQAERVWEGDPTKVGARSSSGMRSRTGLTLRVEPSFSVTRSALINSTGDVAAELAARLINDVRALPRM